MFERKLERDQSDRSTIQFTRVTQPVLKVGRATSRMHRKMCPADPHGIRAQMSKGTCVRGPERQR